MITIGIRIRAHTN